jgi:hypothetical protein
MGWDGRGGEGASPKCCASGRAGACSCGPDVGQGEIAALEREGFARRLAERIGKTVAEIQARLVTAPAEVAKGLPSQFAVLEGERFDDDARRKKASAWRRPSGPSWLSVAIDSST